MISLIISAEFEIGQTVYHRTDPNQLMMMVVSLLLTAGADIDVPPIVGYGCTIGSEVTFHNGFELSENCDTAMKYMSNDD